MGGGGGCLLARPCRRRKTLKGSERSHRASHECWGGEGINRDRLGSAHSGSAGRGCGGIISYSGVMRPGRGLRGAPRSAALIFHVPGSRIFPLTFWKCGKFLPEFSAFPHFNMQIDVDLGGSSGDAAPPSRKQARLSSQRCGNSPTIVGS